MKGSKRWIYGMMILVILVMGFPGACFADADEDLAKYYEEKMQAPEYATVKAKVLDIPYDDTQTDKPDVPRVSDIRYQHLKVKIITGKHKGEVFTVKNTIEMINPYKLLMEKGDTILLRLYEDKDGMVENLVVYERSREMVLYASIGFFMLLLVAIGGKKGIKSVITLVFTAVMVIFVLLPLALKGWNPILISTLVCIGIAAVTLLLVSGWNTKTLNAFLGALGGVMVAGALALIAGNLCKLTGLGNEDAQLLAYIPQHMNMDYKGLLFAGIIIGALGAVMDVTMSVASAMWEIKEIQSSVTAKTLIRSGMNIGKDVMGSMSNTLILAYAGGSIHMMLLLRAFKVPMLEILNMDFMASEIIRAIAGSIGLVCAIPLTAFLGGLLHTSANREQKNTAKA